MKLPSYEIVRCETDDKTLVLTDVGPWDVFPTITNGAEVLLAHLMATGIVQGRRILYYDSEGELTELLHRDGRFVGFAPCVEAER